jgi:hypothetical protein
MKWLATLVVIGLALAWLGSRSLDVGFGALDRAVEVRQDAQRRSEAMAKGDLGPTGTTPVPAPAPGTPAVVPAPAAAKPVVSKPAPAPVVRLTPDLLGLTRDRVEARLGSPTGRIYGTREEWWYDRQVLVFRDGRVAAIE